MEGVLSEGVLSEGVLSEGVLSGGGFVRAPSRGQPPAVVDPRRTGVTPADIVRDKILQPEVGCGVNTELC